MNFNTKEYYETELKLARGILLNNPKDQTQRDRAAYAAAKLGYWKIAEEFGTSEKLREVIERLKNA